MVTLKTDMLFYHSDLPIQRKLDVTFKYEMLILMNFNFKVQIRTRTFSFGLSITNSSLSKYPLKKSPVVRPGFFVST